MDGWVPSTDNKGSGYHGEERTVRATTVDRCEQSISVFGSSKGAKIGSHLRTFRELSKRHGMSGLGPFNTLRDFNRFQSIAAA